MSKPVIKWSGSKRSQAKIIKSLFPCDYETYYEPFVGGGSVLYELNPVKAVAGDICHPLISLWKAIQNNPRDIYRGYKERWEFFRRDAEFFYDVRDRFNKAYIPDPCDFLFLTRTCMNGLIRFNKNGKFNTSCHIGRNGINPERLYGILLEWNARIKNTEFLCADFNDTLSTSTKKDIVYLDPPYQNTKGMYSCKLNTDSLFECLENLNTRGVRWIMSYDGKSGGIDKTCDIPLELYKKHEYIQSGISSFKRIVTKEKSMVYESLYKNF